MFKYRPFLSHIILVFPFSVPLVNNPISVPLVLTQTDIATGLNSPNTVQTIFMNVNNQKGDEVITVTAGSEINMKCSATGNTGGYSSWTWSWEWSIPTFYTELTGHTQASPTPTISNGVDG